MGRSWVTFERVRFSAAVLGHGWHAPQRLLKLTLLISKRTTWLLCGVHGRCSVHARPARSHRAACTARVCGAGVSPVVNPASTLYNGEAFRTRHLLFDAEDPQATDPSGFPYAFRPLPFPGFPEGYTIWFDMGLPQQITQHRLQYLRDASFFSPRRAETATLQFAGIDVQRSTVALARLRLLWDDGGTIKASVTVVGMPLTTASTSAWVRAWA